MNQNQSKKYQSNYISMLTKVAIVGAGPVGLLGCLLLNSFKLDFACYERATQLRAHPSAHWLSARSKQIFSQLEGLPERIDAVQEDYANFQYYRYCQSVGGREFGRSDHFQPSIPERLQRSRELFGQVPNHISQNRLLEQLYQHLPCKEKLHLGQDIKDISSEGDLYVLRDGLGKIVGQSEYVILCTGANSNLRDQLGIRMGGGRQFYRLINIHFRSVKLGQLIKQNNCQAMLHFVFNNKIPSVLVNHSLKDGDFVLQIPNYEPFHDLLGVYSPLQLLESAISPEFFQQIESNLEIVQTNKWRLRAQLADRMIEGKILLAGDAAHSYTPAGGFGMNSGFQDIHQLAHTLHIISRNPQADYFQLLQQFSQQRLAANRKYLEQSLINYSHSQQMSDQLGLNNKIASTYFNISPLLPKIGQTGQKLFESMRLATMKTIFTPKQVDPKLQLFYDHLDSSAQNLSKAIPQIYNSTRTGSYYDFWADPAVTPQQLATIAPGISSSNILRVSLPPGQLVARRDGVLLL